MSRYGPCFSCQVYRQYWLYLDCWSSSHILSALASIRLWWVLFSSSHRCLCPHLSLRLTCKGASETLSCDWWSLFFVPPRETSPAELSLAFLHATLVSFLCRWSLLWRGFTAQGCLVSSSSSVSDTMLLKTSYRHLSPWTSNFADWIFLWDFRWLSHFSR